MGGPQTFSKMLSISGCKGGENVLSAMDIILNSNVVCAKVQCISYKPTGIIFSTDYVHYFSKINIFWDVYELPHLVNVKQVKKMLM